MTAQGAAALMVEGSAACLCPVPVLSCVTETQSKKRRLREEGGRRTDEPSFSRFCRMVPVPNSNSYQ